MPKPSRLLGSTVDISKMDGRAPPTRAPPESFSLCSQSVSQYHTPTNGAHGPHIYTLDRIRPRNASKLPVSMAASCYGGDSALCCGCGGAPRARRGKISGSSGSVASPDPAENKMEISDAVLAVLLVSSMMVVGATMVVVGRILNAGDPRFDRAIAPALVEQVEQQQLENNA